MSNNMDALVEEIQDELSGADSDESEDSKYMQLQCDTAPRQDRPVTSADEVERIYEEGRTLTEA